MPNQLPVTIDFGTLPLNNQGYTPQEYANLLGLNGKVFTEQAFALFVTGNTAPTSNVGPWLANGNEWRVWDSGTGTYVPITINQGSLGYFIGNTAPDHTIYQFWIETDAPGSPLALKIYYSGAWVDVYATKFATYSTTTAMNAAIAAGDAATLASANAYTDAAVAGIPAQNQHPAVSNATGQTETADGTDYAVTGFSYVAPATGWYFVSATAQFDNGTADASNMQILWYPTVNGASAALGSAAAVASPPGSRWFPTFGCLVQATAGDTISVKFEPFDTVGTGTVTLTSGQMHVFQVPG